MWDDDQLPNWRRYAKLRTQLYPYLVAADAKYRPSGLPVMRHLALAYPHDPRALALDDEFLFGPGLAGRAGSAAGRDHALAVSAAGRWIDLWRSVAYQPATGGLRLGRARLLSGRRATTVSAPLG